MKVFVGYDTREDIAYQVCKHSIETKSKLADVRPLKQQELQQKAQKDFVDAALKNEKIEADKAIAGAKLGVELAKQEKDLTEKQKLEGVKLGLDIARSTDDKAPGQ